MNTQHSLRYQPAQATQIKIFVEHSTDPQKENWIPHGEGSTEVRLLFNERPGGAFGNTGHYDGYTCAENSRKLAYEKLLYFLGKTEAQRRAYKLANWNPTSVREIVKRSYLLNFLLWNEIYICCLQETFLIEGDKFYLKYYRIFRCDNIIRRKGVAVLIRKNLNILVDKLEADSKEGRYLKLALTDPQREHQYH